MVPHIGGYQQTFGTEEFNDTQTVVCVMGDVVKLVVGHEDSRRYCAGACIGSDWWADNMVGIVGACGIV